MSKPRGVLLAEGDPGRCTNVVMRAFGVCTDDARTGIGVLQGLRQAGWRWQPVDFDDPDTGITKRWTLRQFVRANPKGDFVLATRGHSLALRDGVLTDTSERGVDGRWLHYAMRVWR